MRSLFVILSSVIYVHNCAISLLMPDFIRVPLLVFLIAIVIKFDPVICKILSALSGVNFMSYDAIFYAFLVGLRTLLNLFVRLVV